jgi:lipoate-protein ligase A
MKAYFLELNNYKAAFNMAADFFLLKLAEKEDKVFLRFYKWEKPTVSFGKNQKNIEKLKNYFNLKGYDIVKRPSGGRAVLHHNDFTYSFIAPLKFFKKQNLKNIYYDIAEPFLKTFKFFKENVTLKTKEKSDYFKKFMCFSSTSLYEIKKDGKKLLGSAQYRTANAVLQHGTGYYDKPLEDGKYFFDFLNTVSIFDKFIDSFFLEKLKENFEKKFLLEFKKTDILEYEKSNIEKIEYLFKI